MGEFKFSWYAILYAVIELIGIASALGAVMWSRTSQGATAWAISLITMPVFALPAYAVFGGRRFRGYVSRRKSSDERLKAQWDEYSNFFKTSRCFAEESPDACCLLEKLADRPFVHARTVKLLKDGEQFYPALKAAFENAKRFIDVQYYTFNNDGIGTEIAELLEKKAREGVQVRLLYDSVGSNKTPERFFTRLRTAGVRVEAFVSSRWRGWRPKFQINFRNHRKLATIDNEVIFLGGMNVGDEYLSRNPKIGHWRDTSVCITGAPAVQGRSYFLSDWYWSTREVLEFEPVSPLKSRAEGPATLVLGTAPVSAMRDGLMPLLCVVQAAKKRLWLTTPYLVPDDAFTAALQLAALRGVDVKLLVTDKTDNLLPQLASYSFYDELLEFGVEIHKYEDGLLHQKVVLVDDELSYVGSTNLDNRSFHLNFEIGAWFSDRAMAHEIETMLLQDLKSCQRLEKRQLRNMPLYRRLICGLARLLAPAL